LRPMAQPLTIFVGERRNCIRWSLESGQLEGAYPPESQHTHSLSVRTIQCIQ
jgi:hypothetical protein